MVLHSCTVIQVTGEVAMVDMVVEGWTGTASGSVVVMLSLVANV
jgi:hypothetical protein